MQSDTTHANKQLNEIKKARAVNRLILYGVLSAIAIAVIVLAVTNILS